MVSPDGLRAGISAYVEAINARDPQGIAALFTKDAVQADPAPATRGPSRHGPSTPAPPQWPSTSASTSRQPVPP